VRLAFTQNHTATFGGFFVKDMSKLGGTTGAFSRPKGQEGFFIWKRRINVTDTRCYPKTF
jgi:hypothetical protein